MTYIPASEVQALNELFSQPPDIVVACNRVQRRYQRAMGHRLQQGILCGLLAAGAAIIAAVVSR